MSPFGLFKRKPKIEGSLGYFGLGDWWLETFTPDERAYVEEKYQPFSSSPREKPLTHGRIHSTTQIATALLGGLASWFLKPADKPIADRILAKAEKLGRENGEIIDLHFAYHQAIKSAYRARDTEPGALEGAIEGCGKQIAIAPQAAEALLKEPWVKTLPVHTGYTQLAIILHKQGEYAEVIKLCEQAKKQGWNDNWDRRIERAKKKLGRR